MKVASIDLGSNSIHMVVAEVDADGRFRIVDRARERVRLGRGDMRALDAAAMEAGLRALRAFRILMTRAGVERYRAAATSAVREAANGGDFLQKVEGELGLRVRVIPGREEARLIHLGVSHGLDLTGGPTAIVDLGGGSVEVVLVDGGKVVALDSRKLGVVRLEHAFLSADPAGSRDLEALAQHVADELGDVLEQGRRLGIERLVVTSGTLLTLMEVAAREAGRDVPSVHHLTLARDDVGETCRRVMRLDRERRLRLDGVDPKRVDAIVPGAVLASVVLEHLRPREVVACTWALREGLLLDYIQRHRRGIEEAERVPDLRRRGVLRFARHLGHDLRHGEHVSRLALRLFDQLGRVVALEPREREWLEWASLLHDVGHVIDHEDHQHHAYYLITRGNLVGLPPEDREIVGLIARYHRKAPPRSGDAPYGSLPRPLRRSVRVLTAILRVADALDRSHFSVVQDVTVSARGARLTLGLHTAGQDAQLEVWEANRRSSLLAKVVQRPVAIRVAPSRKGARIRTGGKAGSSRTRADSAKAAS